MTKSEAWDYAIGMLKVDGLTPTKDFQEYIEKEKRDEITVDDIKKFLDKNLKYRKLPLDCVQYFDNCYNKT